MRSLQELELDGFEALRSLIENSEYRTIEQAIASLSLFSHPETVAQTDSRALFPIIRDAPKRGQVAELNGKLIGYDDNTSPTQAFLWSNQIRHRPRDIQFNHIYSLSSDSNCYTNLANICISPSFLAKLTDTDPQIKALLQYRAFDLFNWHPEPLNIPPKPDNYDALVWSAPLPAVANLAEILVVQVRQGKNRTTRMIEKTGWIWDNQPNTDKD